MSDPVQPPYSRAATVIKLGLLELRSERDGEVHVIALSGELDMASATAVERELTRVEASDADVIRLDLDELDFIDSSGIRLLVMAERRSRRDPGRLLITRPSARVFRVFEIAGIDDVLPFEG